MNTFRNAISTLGPFYRIILASVVVSVLTSRGLAAGIDLWAYVDGRWALIDPNANTGGRRVWNGFYWVTDRVARGETVEAVFSPSDPRESADPIIRSASVISHVGSCGIGGSGKVMTASVRFTVPLDPSWDNNFVTVRTAGGVFVKSLRVARR